MPQYRMNIGPQGIEMDRTCEFVGYDNVGEDPSHMNHETVPFEGPMPPLQDTVVRTSNSQRIQVGLSAGEIVSKTRNG